MEQIVYLWEKNEQNKTYFSHPESFIFLSPLHWAKLI